MATYTSTEMHNSGALGEELSGATTFTLLNVTASNNQFPIGYLVLEGNSTANQNLLSTTQLTGSFGTFNGNVTQSLIVSSSTDWAIPIGRDNGSGSFQFTPTQTIAANSYYIKSTGLFSLTIGNAIIYTFADKAELQTAVNLWISNNTAALATYGEINNWVTTAITNMDQLFETKTTFNSNISNWDVSNVTSMKAMFNVATVFNQPIGSWDVSSVTNMDTMLSNCINFNQPLNDWDVSNVSDMSSMLFNAQAFQQPLNLWEVDSLTDGLFFMGQTGQFSAINYTLLDQLMDGWVIGLAAMQSNVSISFGDSTFTSAGLSARNILVNNKNWTITDGGQV